MTNNNTLTVVSRPLGSIKRLLKAAGLLSLFVGASAGAQNTINTGSLHTWWHNNYEYNNSTPVADGNVRRSTFYDARVATSSEPNALYDSYVYMSLPRGGRDKWLYSHDDGAEFSDTANLTMSWTSFRYSEDTWVEISLTDGTTIASASDVTIRPSHLNFDVQMIDSATIKVQVPYSVDGQRFSVEVDDHLVTAYNDLSGISGNLTTSDQGNAPIHTEPRNALLVFANPILEGAAADPLVPDSSEGSIHYPAPGEVSNLDNISEEIVYFQPGTYYMPWDYHAQLPSQVKWVYLAPGAYVKGAFEFTGDRNPAYTVSGYGVLSGEKYVYEADTANGYMHLDDSNSNCHASCVKMLRLSSSNRHQSMVLHGVTVNEPPYHSFVVYGNEDRFEMDVEHYKQVGGWYWQTDGLELYSNGEMDNSFFHANDDVLKLYHSNVAINDTTIWKNENGPVIQWGWTPREMSNIQVNDTYVIHNRMYWKDLKTNTCVINSSTHWEDPSSDMKANPNMWIRDLIIDNLSVEGMVNCAMRIYALSSTENVEIRNLHIDAWNGLDADSQASHFQAHYDSSGQQVVIGNESSDGLGLNIENYTVNGEYITRAADNWQALDAGRLNFDGELWDNWNAWKSVP